jgi:hypothetical protein
VRTGLTVADLQQAKENFNKYLDNIPEQDLAKAKNFVKPSRR